LASGIVVPVPETARQSYYERPGNIPDTARELIMSDAKTFKLQDLTMLTIHPVVTLVRKWWWSRAEAHYLICADVEQSRAREAQQNAAYYQKRAALARSQRVGNA
jgi:hypothetical protein